VNDKVPYTLALFFLDIKLRPLLKEQTREMELWSDPPLCPYVLMSFTFS